MELDPAPTEVEHARRLADRILGEVEPDEGDHLPFRSLREGERPVVARAKAGMPVGLVEAEHEAAGDAVLLHAALQVLVDADHAVDVGAEMRVRIEDVGALWQLAAKLL